MRCISCRFHLGHRRMNTKRIEGVKSLGVDLREDHPEVLKTICLFGKNALSMCDWVGESSNID